MHTIILPFHVLQSTSSQFGALLDAYFDAWRTHDTKAIERIFSSHATYEIVGGSTLRGVEAIVDYWKRNAAKQRGVRCHIHWVVESGDAIAAGWSAEFDQIVLDEHRILHGMLRLQVNNGQIMRLTEIYEQRISKRAFASGLDFSRSASR